MWISELLQYNSEESWYPQPYNTDYPWSSQWPDAQHAQNLLVWFIEMKTKLLYNKHMYIRNKFSK